MKKIGLIKGMRLCSQFSKLSQDERAQITGRRLKEMVAYAKQNSPYYAERYKDIDVGRFELGNLPPVNKLELMAHFDEWLTDRTVKLSDATEFMKDMDNVGRKLKGKYLVFTTSGSTGNPLVALYDENANNVMSAIAAARSYARKEDLAAFMKRGGKTIGVFATSGFYLSNCTVRARQLSMPWKKGKMGVTSALLPTSEIVAQLNAFKPAMLGGYPSNLELLIDEANAGRLKISPVLIMTGGEYLSPSLRQRLSDVFHCYVQTSYSCTEGGTMACECVKQHFHINDDWVIVEPVDKDNRPVPDGVQSDKLLLTNLYNFGQPYIRYEVTDRIVMHHEPCGCGNPSPWVELEGRTDDMIVLTKDGAEVKVAPLAAYATLKEVHELRRFQLVVYPENRMELRFEPVDGRERRRAFEAASKALLALLDSCGAPPVSLVESDVPPMQHQSSGKFKHIICERNA